MKLMQYKDIEYQVDQTDNPTRWKWTVWMDDRETKTGEGPNRTVAVALAQIATDRLTKSISSNSIQKGEGPTPE
jgi:hypothetical protein